MHFSLLMLFNKKNGFKLLDIDLLYRSIIAGSRWRVKDLTYKISKYPSTRRLSDGDVDGEIRKALDVWSKHTGREQLAVAPSD